MIPQEWVIPVMGAAAIGFGLISGAFFWVESRRLDRIYGTPDKPRSSD